MYACHGEEIHGCKWVLGLSRWMETYGSMHDQWAAARRRQDNSQAEW